MEKSYEISSHTTKILFSCKWIYMWACAVSPQLSSKLGQLIIQNHEDVWPVNYMAI